GSVGAATALVFVAPATWPRRLATGSGGAVREHGTYAAYVFGPEGSDTANGCRCPACRDARRDYEARRKQRAAPPYVSATPAREHIAWLGRHGVGLKRIAEVSGVSHGALWKLVYGRTRADGTRRTSERIRPETA